VRTGVASNSSCMLQLFILMVSLGVAALLPAVAIVFALWRWVSPARAAEQDEASPSGLMLGPASSPAWRL
jgi:hypothetical protein